MTDNMEEILEESVDTTATAPIEEQAGIVINADGSAAVAAPEKRRGLTRGQKAKINRVVGKVLIYLGLVLFALWILVPFGIVLLTSFKTQEDASNYFEFNFFPKEWVADGYKEVFEYTGVGEGSSSMPLIISGLLNTLMIVLPPTLLGLFFSAMSAYAFAKLQFKGKNFLFSFLLVTMMIPGTIMLTPSYLIYDKIGWVGTPFPLMIPGMFGAATCVFFMRQFYSGIPSSLIEAAKLDGMGYFKIFWRIMVPLSVPALLAQGILGFIGGYNDYFGPYLYLTDPEWYTLQVALTTLTSAHPRDNHTVMAGSVIALIPTLLIYIVAQKYFIEGIATSGMKL